MNDLAREDLKRLCSYVFPNEEDNFIECMEESPEAFPGLTNDEIEELNEGAKALRRIELIEKAANCEANQHPYACAFRLHREFCQE